MHWYFGNSSANLQFDKSGRGAYLEDNQATPFGTGGSAVVADQYTGNLIFYTDGVNLYDRSHRIVPNGNLVIVPGGDINQSAAASPVPGTEDRFYIFSNTGTDILVAVADRSIQGNAIIGNLPLGDVISAQASIGLTNPAEGMAVISNDAGTVFWLLSQDKTTFDFRVTRIDNSGTFPTTNFNFNSATNPGSEVASIAFNSDSTRIAIAPKDANRNVQILTFDAVSGNLQFDRQINNTGFDDGSNTSVYDVAWSPDGTKLYLSRFGSAAGNNANLYQFDALDTLENVNSLLNSPVFRSFGIKQGPDNRIYHLYQENNGSPVQLGRINDPDSAFTAVRYDSLVFPDVDFDATQFPEFAPSKAILFSELSFTHLDSCQSDETKFIPTIVPSPTTVLWDFGDGSSSDLHSPIHSYDSPGAFSVSLTAEINGQRRTVSEVVQVFPNDMMVNLGNDTTICPGEILELDAGMEATQFLWSTGEVSQTIQVDTTGLYWVEATYPSGCSSFDAIKVTTYRDTTIFYNQWYFGERAGIDFNPTVRALADENIMDSPEGCASFSDLNGDLLFYTNGNTVWNKDHLIMENGETIGGDSTSTQAAIAVNAPYDSTIYYVFTTQQIEKDSVFTSYSIVDMKYDLARGKVVAKNVPLFFNSTERLTVNAFFGDIALLAHEFGNNSFREYGVTQEGITNPVYHPVGTIHDKNNEELAKGYLKYSSNNLFVAVPLQEETQNTIEVFDYNAQADSIFNPRRIDIGVAPPEKIYGVEFSPDGTELYLTTQTQLIRYSLDSLGTDNELADVIATREVLTTGSAFGALQLGADGQIYMAVDGATTIPRITGANGLTPSVQDFDLAGRTSRLGLPEFAQQVPQNPVNPSLSITAGCVGQISTFNATGRDTSIEMYTWDVGVPGQAPFTDQTFEYTYPEAGTYLVTLTLSNRCDTDSVLTETVEIFAAPEQPTNPPAIPFCEDEVAIEAWPVDDPTLNFNWSTGETTRTITVTEPSTVSVFIINGNGCISDTVTTLVIDARPLLDIGNDLILCQNEIVPDLDARNAGADYTWTIDGVPASTDRFQPVDTSVPGLFTYAVTVVDPVSFCVNSDTVNITVLEQPDVTITTTQTSGCGNDDGAIDITVNQSGNYSYAINGPSSVSPGPVDGPISVPQFNGLAPGNYEVTITNNVTACAYSEVVQIEDNASFGISANPLADCGDDGDLALTITNDANLTAGSVFVTIQDQDGQILTDDRTTYDGTTAITVGPEFTTTPYEVRNIPVGTYFISLQETAGNECLVTTSVTLGRSFPEADISFEPIQSVCSTNDPVIVTNNNPAIPLTFEWSVVSGPGSLISSSGNEAQVDGNAILQVIARGTNVCDRTEQIEVDFGSELEGDIEVIGDPCDGLLNLNVAVTNGSGDFSYNWNNGAGSTPSIEVTASNTYVVTVRDRVTGCEESYSADIVIEDELDVDIVTEPDCDNNGDLFLIAESSRNDVTFTWTDPGNEVISSENFVVISTSGTYSVTVTSDDGNCQLTESFNAILSTIDEEAIGISPTATFCSRDTQNPGTVLRAGPGYNNYEWRLLPDATIIGTDSTLAVSEEGRYEVSLTLGSSCVSRVITVTEDCEPRIDLPNAFSPNGNGQNDVFFAFPNPYVTEFEIHIYNRWGELIFYSMDPNFNWDGNFNNKPVPVDTYAYVIRFESNLDTGRKQTIQRGTVTVVR
ncbi:MAG: gliding motility-associated C-terminal domain-containing protein [Cyclobacteriaceae bacterium]